MYTNPGKLQGKRKARSPSSWSSFCFQFRFCLQQRSFMSKTKKANPWLTPTRHFKNVSCIVDVHQWLFERKANRLNVFICFDSFFESQECDVITSVGWSPVVICVNDVLGNANILYLGGTCLFIAVETVWIFVEIPFSQSNFGQNPCFGNFQNAMRRCGQ